ncbi:MAG: PucR family transcriptional regulator [Acidimicrobiales bacterium]
MTDGDGLAVGEVLALPVLARAEVVAGRSGMGRLVTGVNIVEVPDVSRWLRGGELLFTAGYAWRGDGTQLVDAVRDFDRLGVSALAFKLGTYLAAIPVDACAAADGLGLPIIRLPESVAYMDVIDPLNHQLRARRLWMFERLRDTEQQLLAPGLDEQSVERVAGVLARQIGRPVQVVDLVDDLAVTAAADGRTETALLGELEPQLAADVASVRRALDKESGRTPRRVDIDAGRVGLCAPLVVSHEQRGYVLVAESDGPVDDFVRFGLAHASELVSFLLLKRLSRLEGRGEAMAYLVRSLLADALGNEDAVERALALGLRLARPCVALVVGPSGRLSDDNRLSDDKQTELRTDLSRALGRVPHALGPDGDRTVVLLQADDGTAAALELLAARLLDTVRRHGVGQPVVAVGSVRAGLDGLRRSWSEASIAYQTRGRVPAGGVVHFDDLGAERLLSQIPLTDVTTQYVRATIGPIADDPELLRTLQVYVESGGHKLETAKKLPLHRSSLGYRLDKIARLLDVDLGVPERQLELWLALRLRQIHALADVGPAAGDGRCGHRH